MKFELTDYHRYSSDSELIDDLKHVAEIIKKDTVTLDEYNDYGSFHSTTLTRRFGSWFKCLEMAGLSASRSRIGISNERFCNLFQLFSGNFFFLKSSHTSSCKNIFHCCIHVPFLLYVLNPFYHGQDVKASLFRVSSRHQGKSIFSTVSAV